VKPSNNGFYEFGQLLNSQKNDAFTKMASIIKKLKNGTSLDLHMFRHDPHLSNSACNIPLDLEFIYLRMISLFRSCAIRLN
jgi:hypothetical protein